MDNNIDDNIDDNMPPLQYDELTFLRAVTIRSGRAVQVIFFLIQFMTAEATLYGSNVILKGFDWSFMPSLR